MRFLYQFRDAMAQAGIGCNVEIIADSKLHRFHVQGDSQDTQNGWYVLHDGELPAGAYGCWKRAISETWCIKSIEQMTLEERKTHTTQIKEIHETVEKDKIQAQTKAKDDAKAIWEKAKPANPQHPYLTKKRITPGTLRMDDKNNLLVPIYGTDKQLHSLQFISTSAKWFLSGGAVKGHYSPIGKPMEPNGTIYIAEGYATIMTIHQATGCPGACALNCGNLLAVGKALRAKFPNAPLVFAADNDQWTPDTTNVGILKATEAAQALGAKMIAPNFDGLNTQGKPTDFNDLMQLAGIDEVKQQLTPLPIKESSSIDDIAPLLRPKLHEDAFFGVIKSFVDASRVNSEASAVAVAANALSYFCAIIERKAFQYIGDSIIHCRPFFLLIGNSGKARKGTSEYLPKRVFELVENKLEMHNPKYTRLHLHGGGLSSGEGIAYAIRDASEDHKSLDLGVTDKRLLVIEPEFANVLAQCKRETSTLSPTIRNLFDGKTLAPLTKTNRVIATNPHVVIIGHITQMELHAKSGALEATNGFLNRFLICSIERDQLVALPQKTSDSKLQELSDEMINILLFIDTAATQSHGKIEVQLSEAAETFWIGVYPTLTAEQEGIIGALTARMEMYTRMLAMIFCLLDKKLKIEVKHLKAALSWITYVQESIEYVFGDPLVQKRQLEIDDLAESIIFHLKKNGSMTKTELNNAFGGNVTAAKIDKALHQLHTVCPPILKTTSIPTNGRPKLSIQLCLTEKTEKG